nr:hypothetical protein [Gimesia benthica]
MSLFNGGFLVAFEGIFLGSGRIACNAFFQLSPVNGGLFQIIQTDSGDRGRLILDSLFCVASPFVGGRDPEPMGKLGCFNLFTAELTSGSREEGIDLFFIDGGAFLVTFALDRPEIPLMSQRYQIDTRIFAAEILTRGKLIPEPDVFELGGIDGIR